MSMLYVFLLVFFSRLGIQPFQLGPGGHVDSSIQVENRLDVKVFY